MLSPKMTSYVPLFGLLVRAAGLATGRGRGARLAEPERLVHTGQNKRPEAAASPDGMILAM